MTSLSFCFLFKASQKILQMALPAKKCDQIGQRLIFWAGFQSFGPLFSNIGKVFCQIWGTFGGFLKPSFTLGHFFKWRIGQFNFFPKRVWSHWSHHGFFFITEMGMTKFVITFQLAWFLRKYAKVVVNQLYISCRVSCFSGDSTTACTISKEAKQVSRNQPQLE